MSAPSPAAGPLTGPARVAAVGTLLSDPLLAWWDLRIRHQHVGKV